MFVENQADKIRLEYFVHGSINLVDLDETLERMSALVLLFMESTNSKPHACYTCSATSSIS